MCWWARAETRTTRAVTAATRAVTGTLLIVQLNLPQQFLHGGYASHH